MNFPKKLTYKRMSPLIQGFRDYLVGVRHLAETTAGFYASMIQRALWLAHAQGAYRVRVDDLSPARASDADANRFKNACGRLREYLAYKGLDDDIQPTPMPGWLVLETKGDPKYLKTGDGADYDAIRQQIASDELLTAINGIYTIQRRLAKELGVEIGDLELTI